MVAATPLVGLCDLGSSVDAYADDQHKAVYTGFAGMKGSAAIGRVVCIGTYILLIGFVALNLGSLRNSGREPLLILRRNGPARAAISRK